MPSISNDDRRHGHRYPFFRTVHYAQQGRRHRGLLQNLSLGGVRMLCYGGLAVGQRLWLTLPGSFQQNRVEEPIQGEIVWSRGSATGVQFVDVASICAHGIEDLLSSYHEHAHPSEVNLHEGTDETAEAEQPPASREEGPARGRRLYAPRA